MTKNLSGEARLVLQLAEQEAHRFQHEYVGTEHLLLGLVAEENCVAESVLRAKGSVEIRAAHWALLNLKEGQVTGE